MATMWLLLLFITSITVVITGKPLARRSGNGHIETERAVVLEKLATIEAELRELDGDDDDDDDDDDEFEAPANVEANGTVPRIATVADDDEDWTVAVPRPKPMSDITPLYQAKPTPVRSNSSINSGWMESVFGKPPLHAAYIGTTAVSGTSPPWLEPSFVEASRRLKETTAAPATVASGATTGAPGTVTAAPDEGISVVSMVLTLALCMIFILVLAGVVRGLMAPPRNAASPETRQPNYRKRISGSEDYNTNSAGAERGGSAAEPPRRSYRSRRADAAAANDPQADGASAASAETPPEQKKSTKRASSYREQRQQKSSQQLDEKAAASSLY